MLNSHFRSLWSEMMWQNKSLRVTLKLSALIPKLFYFRKKSDSDFSATFSQICCL